LTDHIAAAAAVDAISRQQNGVYLPGKPKCKYNEESVHTGRVCLKSIGLKCFHLMATSYRQ